MPVQIPGRVECEEIGLELDLFEQGIEQREIGGDLDGAETLDAGIDIAAQLVERGDVRRAGNQMAITTGEVHNGRPMFGQRQDKELCPFDGREVLRLAFSSAFEAEANSSPKMAGLALDLCMMKCRTKEK